MVQHHYIFYTELYFHQFLGHGKCDTFNKQTLLNGYNGKATADDRSIGEHAWGLLKSFNFDPKELRGLGIQIQKLEPTSNSIIAGLDQAMLPFRSIDGHIYNGQVIAEPSELAEDNEIELIATLPKNNTIGKELGNELLPTMSQIDLSVFQALPAEVQHELHAEIKRRSESPAIHVMGQSSRANSRHRSVEPIVTIAAAPAWPQKKITVKGSNVKRIAHQLAPRKRGATSPKKYIFDGSDGKRPLGQVNVTNEELRKLDIDPDVFSALPVDMQREQLSMVRALKAPGGPNVIVPTQRMVLKPFVPPKVPGVLAYRMPPAPQAKYPKPAVLRQQGKEKGTKLHFTETDDVQGVIEAWVEAFRKRPPNAKDIDFFARWLTKCVDGGLSADSGMERAVAVVKWWLVLLRRYWGSYEVGAQDDFAEYPLDEEDPDDVVARAWWTAFKDVKARMNEVARKKFGGSLAIR
jgi:DNA repair protein REV1